MPTIADVLRALLRANDEMASDGPACWCSSAVTEPCEACQARSALAETERMRAAGALPEGE